MELKENVNYKIDLSWIRGTARRILEIAIQKKAFELGFKWVGSGQEIQSDGLPYIFFSSDKKIYIADSRKAFESQRYDFYKISVNNWLNCSGFQEKDCKPKFVNLDSIDYGAKIRFNGEIYNVEKKTYNNCLDCYFVLNGCCNQCMGKHILFKKA